MEQKESINSSKKETISKKDSSKKLKDATPAKAKQEKKEVTSSEMAT